MKKEQIKGNLMLLCSALIWGSAFVAQSVGMDYLGPFAFNAARSLIGFIVLVPAALMFDRLVGKKATLWGTDDPEAKKKLVRGGVHCGVVLAAAALLQQAGIAETTVGKSGFITALYMVMIPLLGMLMGRKVRPIVWGAVACSLLGMYLLCMKGETGMSRGDLLVLAGAFMCAVHIMCIDKYAAGPGAVDGVRLSCIQFLVAAVCSGVLTLIFEKPSAGDFAGAAAPLLYAGVLSSGAAFTLQIFGQRRTGPVVGSMIMSLESVFAALSGWLFLHETLSLREAAGCVLMFAAIIMVQLPEKRHKKSAGA